MTVIPNKISAFLRRVGEHKESSFIVPKSGGIAIDATNFYAFEQGNPNISFDFSISGYYGQGYMKVGDQSLLADLSWPSISFPISVEKSGNVIVYLRAYLASSTFDYDILLDDNVIISVNKPNYQPTFWSWFSSTIVIPDTNVHKLTIVIKSKNSFLDTLYLTQSTLSSTLDLTNSPYVTVHAKVYSLSESDQPENEVPVYNAKNTLTDILIDDWYNFPIPLLPGQEFDFTNERYAFFLFTTGSSPKRYIIWDYSESVEPLTDPYQTSCALIYNSSLNIWQQRCENRFALKIYSYRDPLDSSADSLLTLPASIISKQVNKFDSDSMSPYFFNTKIHDITDSTNEVQLSLPDKIVSVLVDQSGSMTWNDNDGLRHDLSRRMINRIQSSYPGDIKYNILTFSGTPVRVNFFAVTENPRLDTNDVSSVASSYYSDQESGYSGVRVVRKRGYYPSTPVDGDIVVEGFIDRAYDDNLIENDEYFYKIFTFNSQGTFSSGIPIKATPRIREIPRGVSNFTANIMYGTGSLLDEHMLALWHFDEGTGNWLYDFTSNQMHAEFNQNEPSWLNSGDVPSGTSGIRFNGSDYFSGSDTDSKFTPSQSMTIMAWVQPFSLSQGYIWESSSLISISCALGINNGYFFLRLGNDIISTNISATIGEWNHVAATYNKDDGQVYIYVNGIQSGPFTSSFSVVPSNRFNIGHSFISGNAFLGKIAELSISSNVRDYQYIEYASILPSSTNDKILDNGDRLIVLNYSVPENYNYSGGTIRIVRKIESGEAEYSHEGIDDFGNMQSSILGYGFPPQHENDGDIIYEDDALPGIFTVTVSDTYIHGTKYDFRIFTQNSIGNFSSLTDSSLLSVEIPYVEKINISPLTDYPSIALAIPQNCTITPGNRKNYLKWVVPNSDSRIKSVRVYYKSSGFPVITRDGAENSSTLIFNGSIDKVKFVHRNIDNNKNAYYAIVTCDQYGHVSTPVFLQSMPLETANETSIPLLEVKKVRYEVVSEEALSLAWDQPVKSQKDISCWFDDRIVIYVQITDEYGASIQDVSKISIEATKAVSVSAGLAEDVFGDSVDRTSANPDPKTLFSISTVNMGDGFVKGLLRTTADFLTLSSTDSISIEIKATVKVPDRKNEGSNSFEFYSTPINITMKNPWSVKLVNYNNDSVDHLCKQTVPLASLEYLTMGGVGFEPNRFKTFDGCYVRRTDPLVSRVILRYRDKALPSTSSVLVSVHDASDPQCDLEESGSPPFIPNFSDVKSRSVVPPSTTMSTRNMVVQNSDGTSEEITYCDIPLQSPRNPQAIMLFIKASYNGYTSRRKQYYVFENILRVELNVQEPNADCIDVAEQSCTAYLIDPNNPNNRTVVPNLQIVRWTLSKGISGKDRPFYSTDTVPAGPGVFSYIRNGTARKVFFGPACGVTWYIYDLGPQRGTALLPEMYAVRASVTYDQLQAFEELPLNIYPINANSYFGSRFLMEMPGFVNELYADGYDYIPLKISRDPNNAPDFSNAECFRECAIQMSGSIYTLNYNQIIEISTGYEFDILWGDDISVTSDDEGYYVFDGGTQGLARANINLSSSLNTTIVYLKINKFIGRIDDSSEGSSQTGEADGNQQINQCICLEIPASMKSKPKDAVVFGRTQLNISGTSRYLSGGGSISNGIPPTVIRLKEPLDVKIVDIRRNGESVTSLLMDGISEHEVIVEATFKNKPVPDGTPLFITITGDNPESVLIETATIYTAKANDTLLNPSGDERSFASFTMFPFSPNISFNAQVEIECRYDRMGTVDRSMKACLSISYDSSQQSTDINDISVGQINSVFSSRLDRYDTVSNEWLQEASMQHPRGGLSLSFDGNNLFAIGGIDGVSITAYNEKYDITSGLWSSVANLPSGRFYHMSAFYGGNIYIIGGLGIVGSDLQVMQNLYAYDTLLNTWTELSPMPTIGNVKYGIAMGSAVVYNQKIYILCGINQIGNQGQVQSINDRILIYDINTDTWSVTDPFENLDLEMYARISPLAFVGSSSLIHVLGGAISPRLQTVITDKNLEYLTDSFAFNTSTLLLERDDFNYQQMPLPRYKGGISSISNDRYILGGSNAASKVSRRFEGINDTSIPYDYTRIDDINVGRNSFGMSGDESRYLYACGGITSGRSPGFLKIDAKVSKSSVNLDGRESVGIDVYLKDESGQLPTSDVRVLVRGYLVFPGGSFGGSTSSGQQDSVLRENLVYPVLFTSNDFTISNGVGSVSILPRSDDILRKMDEIKLKLGITESLTGEGIQDNKLVINEGETRLPYSISVQITIVDDYFYGQTSLVVSDSENTSGTSSTSGSSSTSSSSSSTSNSTTSSTAAGSTVCRSISGTVAVSGSGDTGGSTTSGTQITKGLNAITSSSIFDLNPNKIEQNSSPSISYYCDINWIPQVVKILGSNDGTYEEALNAINRLKNDIPFGGSPLFDGIISTSDILIEDSAHNYSKVIYIHTDNEENLSTYNSSEAIESVQSIDGNGKTPIIINNLSIVFPTTLSALVSRTDTDSLDTISLQTGGQSQTILDAIYVDDVLNNSMGRLVGSIGWGLYESVIDLGEDCIINSSNLDFTLYQNTDANWKISVSSDGYNYSDWSDQYSNNDYIHFSNLQGRYVKYHVELISGLSSSIEEPYDAVPTAGQPSLTGINIEYSKPEETFIFVNPEVCDFSAQQIIASVNSTRPIMSVIDVGAATSISHNWIDFANGSQPTVDQRGKIFIPVRMHQDSTDLNEPLISMDGFAWKAKYGSWNFDSDVVITNSSQEVIDSTTYRIYPRDGIVVFSSKQNGPLYISIENSGNLRLGIRIINKIATDPVRIYGFGFLYNTNIFLPSPLSEKPPSATDIKILPELPYMYSKMLLSYTFVDINGDSEDTDQREIRWYINGIEKEFLRNLTSWNDIYDTSDPLWTYAFTFKSADVPSGQSIEEFARSRGESILKVGDKVYATIKTSDGKLIGAEFRSPSVEILESPPFVSKLQIKGRRINGTTQETVTTATVAFADYSFYGDGNLSETKIRWYVNSILFKEGTLGGTINGLPNNEIQTGEQSSGIVPLTIGNEIEVEIVPISNNTIGNLFRSSVITVQNDPPVVRNVILSPSQPMSSSNLQVTYQFFDTEISQGATLQSNQSSIKWFKAARGSNDFVAVSSLDNQSVVSNIYTSSGEKWKAKIIPFDGISVGEAIDSNIVTIQ